MEDTLGVIMKYIIRLLASLNPCFNGRYSRRYGQDIGSLSNAYAVLILVLMEDTLGVSIIDRSNLPITCLNPCFNGRYSRRKIKSYERNEQFVLILVLMEDTLGDLKS